MTIFSASRHIDPNRSGIIFYIIFLSIWEYKNISLKIVIIIIIAMLSIVLGGWIATRIIKMDGHKNLIDW